MNDLTGYGLPELGVRATPEPIIALGLTLKGELPPSFALIWFELMRSKWWPGPVVFARDMYPVDARNEVVRKFLEADGNPRIHDQWAPGEVEALLFADSDMLPPGIVRHEGQADPILYTDHLSQLLRDHPDKGVFAGLYFTRGTQFKRGGADGGIIEYPHDVLAFEKERPEGGFPRIQLKRMTEEILPLEGRYRLHEIGAAGTGAMMIRKRVLLELIEAKRPRALFEAPEVKDQPGKQWNEDMWFCHELGELLGETVWLDAAGEWAHRGDQIWLTSQHYLAGHGMVSMNVENALKQQGIGIDALGRMVPNPVNRSRENERRKSRIILPRE